MERLDGIENVRRVKGATSAQKRRRFTDEEFKEYLESEKEKEEEQEKARDDTAQKESLDEKEKVEPDSLLLGVDIVDIRLRDVHKIDSSSLAAKRETESAEPEDATSDMAEDRTEKPEFTKEDDDERHIDELV